MNAFIYILLILMLRYEQETKPERHLLTYKAGQFWWTSGTTSKRSSMQMFHEIEFVTLHISRSFGPFQDFSFWSIVLGYAKLLNDIPL